MVANVVNGSNVELEVTAKISPNPQFSIPTTSTEEIVVSSVGTIRETIFGALESIVEKGGAATKGFKFFAGAVANIPFTVIDIAMSYDEEGIAQAVITATTATGVSVATGIALTFLAGSASLPITASAIGIAVFCGALNFTLGKFLDGAYDYGEQVISLKEYAEAKNAIVFETSISDINDIKNAIFPLNDYLNTNMEDLEKITFEQVTSDSTTTYTVKSGDTIWDICDKTGVGYDELKELNPWLNERFSDDGEYALIKSGEKLVLPDYANFENQAMQEVAEWYQEAQTVEQVGDPLLVDLDGDGVISTTGVDDGVYFDHKGDGFMERSSWVGDSDGMMVYDKNGNGVIDDGNEIFGDNYIKSDGSVAESGFDALSDLDSNNDGVINSLDEKFGDIKILKGDGSLLTLDEAGVTSINLNSVESGMVDENGNTVVSVGEFIKSDGASGVVGDYLLDSVGWDTKEVEVVDVSDDIALLPDIECMGNVYGLHQAMARDESGELKGLIQNFVNEGNKVNRRNMVTNILYKWTERCEMAA